MVVGAVVERSGKQEEKASYVRVRRVVVRAAAWRSRRARARGPGVGVVVVEGIVGEVWVGDGVGGWEVNDGLKGNEWWSEW
jgi:hypothetical protein